MRRHGLKRLDRGNNSSWFDDRFVSDRQSLICPHTVPVANLIVRSKAGEVRNWRQIDMRTVHDLPGNERDLQLEQHIGRPRQSIIEFNIYR
jgi:hypothetical protein